MFSKIKKRDGRVVKFDSEKIVSAVLKAGSATGEFDEKTAKRLALRVVATATHLITKKIPTVEDIQDIVEEVLISSQFKKTAKAYIIYREQHAAIRNITEKASVDLVDQYLKQIDWQVKENSNMSFSLQGLNNYLANEISKTYWLNKIYPPEIRDPYIDGDIHIHDLGMISVYCVGWDLLDLLTKGFTGVESKTRSKPAKHLRTALGQVVNFFYTMQGEAAGAQAFSNFDTLLAPFVRYDKLKYKDVKQYLQEFIFNVNVPTRVGFQCVSEDTEILTPLGWKKYHQIKIGDQIKTFNLDNQTIENQKVESIFKKRYQGIMYNLKNRISDQLISPGHRVVRKKFGNSQYILEPIENVLKLKSPVIVPVIKQDDETNLKITDTNIQKITKINYKGVIWCPHTKNETIIARRNGKVFITGNTPFTNITMDLTVPDYYANHNVIIGGEVKHQKYKSFQKEMDMFNKAFLEVMKEGDAKGRVFTFPIPTYNITKDFNWNNSVTKNLWEITAKYGIPYFSNFVNSDMKPSDARSMCCRLRIDNRKLEKKHGGLFGSAPLTGSVGVVTINLPRIGYLSKNKADFMDRLVKLMDISKDSLEIKRKVLERFTDGGLYPYVKFYLAGIKKRFGSYWKNHFSTIGILGMNEACLNLFGKGIETEEGREFALEVLDFMRNRLLEYQNSSGNNYNLEATPAEGTSYRMATSDKKKYPKIICANEEHWKKGKEPYYTNSTQLPVGYTSDIFEALENQDDIQKKYTGGTVLHFFLGEQVDDAKIVKKMVKKICSSYHLPYFTFTPTFSICPNHGYLVGEIQKCPKCKSVCEIYSRVVGYLTPLSHWNKGKKEEFEDRKMFRI